jgi:DNA polymerase bacteriophage-type
MGREDARDPARPGRVRHRGQHVESEGEARARAAALGSRGATVAAQGFARGAARAAEARPVTLLADFETKSDADLDAVGGRNYAAHPSTSVLCAVVHDVASGDVGVWFEGDPPIATDDVIVYHNATDFDRHIAARVGWRSSWADSSVAARRAGLPGSLDALGSRWFGVHKDKAAKHFTVSLSKHAQIEDAPIPPTPDVAAIEDKKARGKARAAQLKEWRKRPAAERREAVMRIVVDYCRSDVSIMERGWPALEPFLRDGVFGAWEGDVLAADTSVNERGIAFDVQLARRLLECDARNCDRQMQESARVLGWTPAQVRTVANSPPQFTQTTGRDDATKETVDEILKHRDTEPPWIVALADARRALATIARGKLEAGLARVSPDGRIRDGHRYYGAHTGRDSHKGLQMGNMTRPPNFMPTHGGRLPEKYADWGDDEISRLVDLCMAGEDLSNEEIEVALRACLHATAGGLAVCDFSSVEARWIAWTARDEKALDVFRSGKIPYKVAAATIFGKSYDDIVKGSDEYDIGKKAELACGYGMGAKKFELKYEPSRVGVDAADIVRGWRELHAPIVQYWRALEDAFIAAVRGTEAHVWPYAFVPGNDGTDVAIVLPSGRPIVYNGTGLSREIGFNGRTKFAPYYVGTKGVREHLYGGKIAENVTQAGCRDLMMAGLVHAERDGLAPVLRVHDELVCDVANGVEGYDALREIMLTLPEWAHGFPVGAAGHHGKRYRK